MNSVKFVNKKTGEKTVVKVCQRGSQCIGYRYAPTMDGTFFPRTHLHRLPTVPEAVRAMARKGFVRAGKQS